MPSQRELAMGAIAEIRAQVARMGQIAPRDAQQDHQFFCNGCKFSTSSHVTAENHALENTHPFPHYLYERERVDGRPKTRIHTEPGPSEAVPLVVKMMMPGRAAA